MRRAPQNQSQHHIDHSDDETQSSSPSQILERVQSDRVTVTKPEEDRRRRTIIVEKKNGSFGFTLQSYGIHYKKEQEIEMITYVDYVDYDGPAYRAGMREGDVILSINGTDMEKADHKTLVNFIKNCEARMRMVVLFEDCVRKVELHMRYIQLQRILQSKMSELEKLCLRERQLLEGKWKTHSLPARKKAQKHHDEATTTIPTNYSYCRPVSTEDMMAPKTQHTQQQPAQPTLILAYQYLDPNYRYMLQPSTSSSGEYLLTFEQPRYKGDDHHFIVKTPCDEKPQMKQINGQSKVKKSHEPPSICNPSCIQPNNSNNSDNTSLDAYDLAGSPCCNPHCVPTARRRSRHKDPHQQKKRDSKTEETQTEPVMAHTRIRPHSTSTQTAPRRYFQFGAGLVSQCSLHSCTSSELSGAAPTTMGESTASYTTSLSTDTLYWNGDNSRQASVKKQHNPPQTNEPIYVQYNQIKPKSWDNLATKAFGGYGFGYGYVDGKNKQHKPPHKHYIRAQSTDKHLCQQTTLTTTQQMIYIPNTQQRHFQANNKSTESLLTTSGRQYSVEHVGVGNGGNSASCEFLKDVSQADADKARFFQTPPLPLRQSVQSPSDPNFGYYSARHTQAYPQNVVSTSSEATRL